jgi:hypothetical protein
MTLASREIRVRDEGKMLRFRRLILLAMATVLMEVLLMEGSTLGQASRRDLGALANASVIYVATVRKDGNQSTAAPVWFTVRTDRDILIQTGPATWKAKRIRRGSPVIVWIGKRTGPAFIGRAQITRDPAVVNQIVADYPKKYLMARLGLHRPTPQNFDQGERVAIEITPTRDLPDGFSSQPGTPAPSLEGQRH